MITQEDMEESVHWIIENARVIGFARRNMIMAERMAERTKAVMMKKHSELPVSAQEREAKASEELKAVYIEEADAAGHFEYLRSLRDAHMARIEAWRSMESTARALTRTAAPSEERPHAQPAR